MRTWSQDELTVLNEAVEDYANSGELTDEELGYLNDAHHAVSSNMRAHSSVKQRLNKVLIAHALSDYVDNKMSTGDEGRVQVAVDILDKLVRW